MKGKSSYDFYLVLATTVVLFVISLISIYGMFYFKFAQIQQMSPPVKMAYMDRMNAFVSPFVIALILLLGICVPKRLLPTIWVNRLTVILGVSAVFTWLVAGGKGDRGDGIVGGQCPQSSAAANSGRTTVASRARHSAPTPRGAIGTGSGRSQGAVKRSPFDGRGALRAQSSQIGARLARIAFSSVHRVD